MRVHWSWLGAVAAAALAGVIESHMRLSSEPRVVIASLQVQATRSAGRLATVEPVTKLEEAGAVTSPVPAQAHRRVLRRTYTALVDAGPNWPAEITVEQRGLSLDRNGWSGARPTDEGSKTRSNSRSLERTNRAMAQLLGIDSERDLGLTPDIVIRAGSTPLWLGSAGETRTLDVAAAETPSATLGDESRALVWGASIGVKVVIN